MNLAFYIHIPYCIKRCGYCDFNTYTPGELQISTGLAEVSNSYIDLLIKEIRLARAQVVENTVVPSIFFGGGTPSLMQASDIGRVISAIKSEFNLSLDAEITMECNPDTVSKESLAQFKEVGVNRVSFGMQSAVKHVLETLDRTHNPDNLLQVTTWAQQIGFKEISVDLIYGTPGESICDWQTSIDSALSLPITHISAYALIIEEGTKLAGQIKRGQVQPVDDDLAAEKYLIADRAFTAAGFNWYELSNWAKPNSASKHNLAYWSGDNWWGAGPGAHSHLNGKRFWNVKHPNLYREKLQSDQSPIAGSEFLAQSQIESERLMLSIRLPTGVAKKTLSEQQIFELSEYVGSGHLDQSNWNDGRATLTVDGRLIADRILRKILL
ncbi:oxygen-independent coproporphyrinogen III oxidase [Candidatus Nanopelagicus hibericus]|uniref:Heme chaperone HemW n=1 Tax=Candidatus Nanopelagicus hibericus TaxID=1884915 RepID=A0A249K9N6_9ACTN|nr:radical SAM family heme chaperone HemW [Candidatus Nanopelagicus hibericus]ASY13498.1 oxygen-independent coproporphyrinogen III oxidase [Candidatus Nanopelagicus hibericus]